METGNDEPQYKPVTRRQGEEGQRVQSMRGGEK